MRTKIKICDNPTIKITVGFFIEATTYGAIENVSCQAEIIPAACFAANGDETKQRG